jgi:hypothetical protein
MAAILVSASAAEQEPLLPDRPFQAVILPADASNSRHLPTSGLSGFWTPSTEGVTTAEKRIARFVSKAPKNPENEFEQKTRRIIQEHPEKFIRQYFGATHQGERVIVCNALPSDAPKDFSGAWRLRYARVFDYAGSWQIYYSTSKDRIIWFFIDQGY